MQRLLSGFKNWSFRIKITVPLLVLAAVFVASFFANLVFTQQMSERIMTTAEEHMPSLDLVLQADRDLYQALVAERSMLLFNRDSLEFAALIESQAENIEQARDRITRFRETTTDAAMKQAANDFLARHSEWAALALQVPEVATRMIDNAQAAQFSLQQAAVKFAEMRIILDDISGPLLDGSHAYSNESVGLAHTSERQQIVTLLISLALCLGIILFFPGFITRPVKQILQGISQVTEQTDFSYRLPQQSNDELGLLARDFNKLLASIETAITDCNELVAEIAEGRFGRTLQSDNKGHLAKLVKGINDTSYAVHTAMSDINQITSELAKGDFEDRRTNKLPGDFGNTLGNAAKAKVAVRSVIAATNHSLRNIADGDFTAEINNDFPGELQGLKTGVNHTLGALSEVFASVNVMMDALKNGNFTMRSHAQLKGQFADIVQVVEGAMAQINDAMQEISGVMSQVVAGQLSTRVSADMAGELDSLKQHINHSLQQIESLNSGVSSVLSLFADGDLTKTIAADFPGDYARLKNDVNRTINNLKDMITNIQTASDEVLLASEQLKRGSSDISSRTEQQAAALEQTMGALENIRAAGQQSKDVVVQVIEVCRQTMQEAAEGEQAMERVISSVNDISESSNKIGSIIRVIDEIAFQTNLLALNAAVEAARAGESGRGFSVVAGEVRDLAGRSANAAKEINALISEIIERVKIGTEVAVDSGSVLKGVITSFQKVNAEVVNIGQSIEEQSNSINEVTVAMKTIEGSTQGTAAVTEETAASSELMANQASGLRRMTAAFRV